ncbi:MAG TPA: hypothetical protein VM529_07560 [Gemmata sp.]|nr:hypothetical protein [Gemmata sp.]
MTLPPPKLILESLQTDILPAAGAGALVMCAFLLLGRWAGALGSAAAVVVAFLAANFTLDKLDFEEEPTWAKTWRLVPWKPAEEAPGWHWLPRAGLLLVAVGVVSRWIGLLAARKLPERLWWGANLLVWAPRVAAVVIASGWLSSGKAASAPEWASLQYQLAAAMLAVWVALDGVARSDAGAEAAAYQGAIFFAGATLIVYAHSKFFMDFAVILSFALFGIAAAAGIGRGDTSGAVPATVAFLPGLMFAIQPSMETHKVPPVAFWLVALAPLMLLPFLVPALWRRTNDVYVRAGRAALVLAPLVAALVLAAQNETLAFE